MQSLPYSDRSLEPRSLTVAGKGGTAGGGVTGLRGGSGGDLGRRTMADFLTVAGRGGTGGGGVTGLRGGSGGDPGLCTTLSNQSNNMDRPHRLD